MSKKIVYLTCIISSMLLGFTTKAKQPNIIYLMLDEWGYFESGHMGSEDLITPNIDQFASEGMRFTNAYAGAPVCGPTRCSLLTGLHAGNMSMRANNGHSPIRADEPTLASMLKSKGYATGGFGKWGIGGRGTTGVPEKHGFDVFFGYYDQVHAHTFYPSYLIRNSEEVPLPGNSGKSFYQGGTHAQLEIFKESIAFIERQKNRPFFCYLPWTPPHGLWGIDKDDPSWKLFQDKPWTAGQQTKNDAKVYAAFMHMVDRQIGEVIRLLKKLKIDQNTIFFLTGDNGGQTYFASKERPHGFFAPNLNPKTAERFREGKGSLYEGGLKIPYLVRWPGKIKSDSISNHLFYHPDVMPTLAKLTDSKCPKTDGISFLPTLLSNGKQTKHSHMYWEYQKQQAVRKDEWKAYRNKKGNWELYDLSVDIEEQNNLADKEGKILQNLIALAESSHQPARQGKILNQALVDKDRREAPHERNLQFKKSKKYNVLVFLVDDLGYMDIGANNPDCFYETPNIDKLAATGMRFTDGYAANPVCSPTRYSLMTGKYPTRVKATNFFSGKRSGKFNPAPLHDKMDLNEITLAEMLKEQGYKTYFAGKWHLGPNKQWWPKAQGFDVNMGGWTKGGPYTGNQYFSPFKNPELHPDSPKGEHLPNRLAEETANYISKNKDQPFLAYLSFYSVHTPLQGRKDLVEKYKKKAAKISGEEFGPLHDRKVRILQKHAVYAAMVEAMDEAVGKVLSALDEAGVSDNTMVFFTSDNGGLSTSEGSPTSNLPLRGGKGWVYEGGIREPWIIRYPGITKPGSVNKEMICSIDLLPTVATAVEAKLLHPVDGIDLTPALRGKKLNREALYWHYPHYSNQGGIPGGAVRIGDYKLFENYENGNVSLYNLRNDIGETKDLSSSDPKRTKSMRTKLHAWYKEVDAKFLQPKGESTNPWSP